MALGREEIVAGYTMLDPHRADIEARLEAQLAMTAIEVLARLTQRHPERPTDSHQRTTQWMVQTWRALQAKTIIHSATAAPVLTPGERALAPAPPPMDALGNIAG